MKKNNKRLFIFGIIIFILLSIAIYASLVSVIIPTMRQALDEIRLNDKISKVQDLRVRGNYEDALKLIDSLILSHEDPDLYNEKGYILITLGKYDDAITTLEKAIAIDPLFDSPYNNLSWAYNELGDYERALEYINESLKFGDNSSNEYVNKGNALYGLNKYEDAIKNYNLAIELNPSNSYAFYGRGICYYELGKFTKAIDDINKSNAFDKDFDRVDLFYLLDSYNSIEDSNGLNETISNFLSKNSNGYETLFTIASTLDSIEEYKTAKEYYNKALNKFLLTKGMNNPYDYIKNPDTDLNFFEDVLYDIGYLNYYSDNYQESIECFDMLISLNPEETIPYVWKIYNLTYLEKYGEAIDISNNLLQKDSEDAIVHNALGNVYLELGTYNKAIECFNKSIELDQSYREPYVNKLYCLFNDKKYTECIDFSISFLELFPNDLDAYWFMADSYSNLYNEELAIEYYKKALEIAPDNETLLLNIGWEYYHIQDYNKSLEYILRVIDTNPNNSQARDLMKAISERSQPLKDRVVDFVKDNYLYLNEVEDFNVKLENFEKKTNITTKDIHDFVDSIRVDNDIFTFTVSENEYDIYTYYDDVESVNFVKLDDNNYYIEIATFNYNTYESFNTAISSISNSEEKNLIINLCSNSGGMIKSANNILDVLLPEVEISTVVDKDGNVSTYKSGPTWKKFKNIYVFVDKYSASGSELVALGLRKHLDNVTILGQKTVGKGVGQLVFDDKKSKIMIYLVNFYWSIGDENILGKGITPDIYIDSNNIEDYLNAIRYR